MYPINKRFCALCLALEIAPRDEGTKEFYEKLRARVLELIDNSYELTDGVLRVERLRNQGPAWSLHNELAAKGAKTGLLTQETAELAVHRLLGFVHSASGWVQVPGDLRGEQAEGARPPHRESFGVVPERVRRRIRELWESAPHLLRNYAEDAVTYLKRERADPLPTAPWNLPYEFEHGHELILDFLAAAKDARAEVTVAAVTSYITASIGQQVFLSLLRRGVTVRFLVFDFVHGDVEHVARMIQRSPDALRVLANDTMEAVLRLREGARAAGALASLEVRLLERDPEGRWYLTDPLGGGTGFVVARASDAPGGAGAVAGGRVTDPRELEQQAQRVAVLWSEAREMHDWLPAYDAWKSEPINQAILGLR